MRSSPAERVFRLLLAAALGASAWGCGCDRPRSQAIEGARKPESVVRQARAAQREARRALDPDAGAGESQILFGDLHVHTSYSWDGFLFSLPLVGGEGTHPPSDACDFARYCADLDFFALTDHAESLLIEDWQASKASIRQCNSLAGDGDDPDLVAFLGFEWSQAGLTPETHWGHRCVVFPGTGDSELPARPIGARATRALYGEMQRNMSTVRWLQPLDWKSYTAYADYLAALVDRAECAPGVDVRELPLDCEEFAATPRELHEKLDQWGFDSLTIPHGTTWGTYTPAGSSVESHLALEQFDPRRQRLIEIMSGHGNSEVYRGFRAYEVGADGRHVCPEPTADFLPCCWQAGEIMRSRCGDLDEAECEARVRRARQRAADAFLRPHNVFPDAAPEEWLDCDQCRGCFKPSFSYRPRQSVQYAMALSDAAPTGFEHGPRRFRYGFVASSDGHKARPGTGYKQIERSMMTDAVGAPGAIVAAFQKYTGRMQDPREPQRVERERIGIRGSDMRVGSFLYPGGLAAVHARGRSRAAIWDALSRREVYGTSGPRILLWFDLVDADAGSIPMGGEITLDRAPRFRVRAVGAWKQRPGCPDWAHAGLKPDRLEWLCRNECYHPSDERHIIDRIEVIRIRPRRAPDEPVGGLIEDPWRTFACEPDPLGCSVDFLDPDFPASGRDTLYYVRALQQPTPAINGNPLTAKLDADGAVLSTRPCWGDDARAMAGCPEPVQERAWSSPIFVDQPTSPGGNRP